MDNSNLPLYALCLNYLLRTDCLSIWITLGTLMKYHQLTGARFLLTVPHPQPFLFFFFLRLEMPDAQKFETNAKEDTWMEIYIQAVCHMVFCCLICFILLSVTIADL